MHILVTGGTGFIGSHMVVELLQSGHTVVVVDNLCNSSAESLQRVERITGKKAPFYQFDLRDAADLNKLFVANSFDAAIHFAGLKAVDKSVHEPLQYYGNNLDSTLVLLDTMRRHNVHKIVFSSSATVYGTPEKLPLTESSRTGVGITNPYGQTKYMIEQILRDLAVSDKAWEIAILRYFNPVGAHESGLIGEDPNGPPDNLVPYISQVAVGRRDRLRVFGNDYDTADGTGVRDYIHVVDLARGHLAAIDNLHSGAHIYNLGTGHGVSVLEAIQTFERVSGQKIPYDIVARRPGDIASCYADPSLAATELGWKTEKTFEDACRDAWRWQSQNPNGYKA